MAFHVLYVMTEANPTSGYDDAIYVVMETTYGDRNHPHTRPISAYRDRDEAERVAEERNGPFKDTSVRCIGLNH